MGLLSDIEKRFAEKLTDGNEANSSNTAHGKVEQASSSAFPSFANQPNEAETDALVSSTIVASEDKPILIEEDYNAAAPYIASIPGCRVQGSLITPLSIPEGSVKSEYGMPTAIVSSKPINSFDIILDEVNGAFRAHRPILIFAPSFSDFFANSVCLNIRDRPGSFVLFEINEEDAQSISDATASVDISTVIKGAPYKSGSLKKAIVGMAGAYLFADSDSVPCSFPMLFVGGSSYAERQRLLYTLHDKLPQEINFDKVCVSRRESMRASIAITCNKALKGARANNAPVYIRRGYLNEARIRASIGAVFELLQVVKFDGTSVDRWSIRIDNKDCQIIVSNRGAWISDEDYLFRPSYYASTYKDAVASLSSRKMPFVYAARSIPQELPPNALKACKAGLLRRESCAVVPLDYQWDREIAAITGATIHGNTGKGVEEHQLGTIKAVEIRGKRMLIIGGNKGSWDNVRSLAKEYPEGSDRRNALFMGPIIIELPAVGLSEEKELLRQSADELQGVDLWVDYQSFGISETQLGF